MRGRTPRVTDWLGVTCLGIHGTQWQSRQNKAVGKRTSRKMKKNDKMTDKQSGGRGSRTKVT